MLPAETVILLFLHPIRRKSVVQDFLVQKIKKPSLERNTKAHPNPNHTASQPHSKSILLRHPHLPNAPALKDILKTSQHLFPRLLLAQPALGLLNGDIGHLLPRARAEARRTPAQSARA
jgi:hypothetical protein